MLDKLFITFSALAITPLGQLVWLPEPYNVLGTIGLVLQLVGIVGLGFTWFRILK
jgi:multidrug transporter EmrE-like cation transporter